MVLAWPAAAAAKEAHLISYGGFGTTDEVVIRGRAHKGAPSSGAKGKGKLRKVATTAHAFMRRDLADAKVLVTDSASGTIWPFQTDGDGFYDAVIPGPFPAGERSFEVSIGEEGYDPAPVTVKVQLVDATGDGLLVISDIDDTIADTGVTGSKAKLVTKVATSNSEDMFAYPLAPETLGAFAAAGVPIIYVTAGPVDLAPRTSEFLARAGFPDGALFLRHYTEDGVGDPSEYKTRHIERIMAVYPKRKVIFFGDNGEKDPELFAAVAKKSGRVAGTFIRATLPATAAEERYAGQTLFETWGGAAKEAGKQKLMRWFTAHRIVLAEEEAAAEAAKEAGGTQ